MYVDSFTLFQWNIIGCRLLRFLGCISASVLWHSIVRWLIAFLRELEEKMREECPGSLISFRYSATLKVCCTVRQARSAVIALYFYPISLSLSLSYPLLIIVHFSFFHSYVGRPAGCCWSHLLSFLLSLPSDSCLKLMQLQTGVLYKFAASLLFVMYVYCVAIEYTH